MLKIVDGIAFEGTRSTEVWEVRTWAQNGIVERSARPAMEWREIGPVGNVFLDACGFPFGPAPDTEEELAEKARNALKKAAQRAKQTCRRVIISEAFDELLTLTYRGNQPDRALCKVHFEKWYRRMKRALGDFRFCASFEKQERGSMHVHVATHRLPKHAHYKGVKVKAWEVGTRIWRDIVGQDNGLCFVGAGKAKWGRRTRRNLTLAKMAAYVSKYILKDFADAPAGSNRFSRSNGVEIADVHVMKLRCSFAELVAVTFEQGDGDVVVSHRVGYFRDSIWLCTEGPPIPSAAAH